jgi:acyl dehydratase
MKTLTLAELAEVSDLELGATAWREVTQGQIDLFADATDDHQWIHVDLERAAAGPFGAPVAHGYLTLSLVAGLIAELLEVPDAVLFVNYGVNRVRFTSPVKAGSRVRMQARLAATEPRDHGVLLTVAATVEIEAAERPALVGELLFLAST